MLLRLADTLTFPRHSKVSSEYEERDIHEIDPILESEASLNFILQRVQNSLAGQFQPVRVRDIKKMGTIWDYRAFTSPNGGRIRPLVYVEHIPVIRQMPGRLDLDVLWRVLVAQGLRVHNGTDGEGNVALYVPMDRLCFHARGANGLSCGTEHMHLNVFDDWSDEQLNAAAFLSHRAKVHHDVPRRHGSLGFGGPGLVTVRKRGHVTHEAVSHKAGFDDRGDPGDKFQALMDEIEERSLHFTLHHKF